MQMPTEALIGGCAWQQQQLWVNRQILSDLMQALGPQTQPQLASDASELRIAGIETTS